VCGGNDCVLLALDSLKLVWCHKVIPLRLVFW
jgi:hypothetical protein